MEDNDSKVEFVKKVGDVEVYQNKSLTISSLDVKRDFAKYLEPEQINDVLANMPASRDRMMCITLWMSGIRVTELINIKKKDLDFKNQVMTVRWQKNKKWNNRNVPLHQQLKDMLYIYSGASNEETLLFSISRQRVFQITKNWFGISPHQFRHSFAVNFLRQTKDIVTLHHILGHSKIQTTMEYLKIVPIDQARVLETVKFT